MLIYIITPVKYCLCIGHVFLCMYLYNMPLIWADVYNTAAFTKNENLMATPDLQFYPQGTSTETMLLTTNVFCLKLSYLSLELSLYLITVKASKRI